MGNRPNTSTLFRRINESSDIEDFCIKSGPWFEEVIFSEYASSICKERGLVIESVIKKAQLDRTYGHQLFNGTRHPSRDKVLQLAFGFPLDLDETQKLLRLAGKNCLYPRVKRDAVIIFALQKKMDIAETQNLLLLLNLPMLNNE